MSRRSGSALGDNKKLKDKIRRTQTNTYIDIITGDGPKTTTIPDVLSRIDGYERILFIVTWYARKSMYDALWEKYELRTSFHSLEEEARAEKLKPQFEALAKIYDTNGLIGYSQALPGDYKELYSFFHQWYVTFCENNIADALKLTILTVQHRKELEALIRAEFSDEARHDSPSMPSVTPRLFKSAVPTSAGSSDAKTESREDHSDKQKSPSSHSNSSLEQVICSVCSCDRMEEVLGILYNQTLYVANEYRRFCEQFKRKLKTADDYRKEEIKFSELFPDQQYFKIAFIFEEDGSAVFEIDIPDVNDPQKLTVAALDNEYIKGNLPLEPGVAIKISSNLMKQMFDRTNGDIDKIKYTTEAQLEYLSTDTLNRP
jgi:hypothetical protein